MRELLTAAVSAAVAAGVINAVFDVGVGCLSVPMEQSYDHKLGHLLFTSARY